MQFKPFEDGIEVSGENVGATLDGFKKYPSVALKNLTKYGILKVLPGQEPRVDRTAWYPMKEWLAAYEGIALEVGFNSLYSIGRSIPENANLSPTHHRHPRGDRLDRRRLSHESPQERRGDVQSGDRSDARGHRPLRLRSCAERKPDRVRLREPVPLRLRPRHHSAMAARFEPTAKTVHDADAPCRKKGAESCTYVVWW